MENMNVSGKVPCNTGSKIITKGKEMERNLSKYASENCVERSILLAGVSFKAVKVQIIDPSI